MKSWSEKYDISVVNFKNYGMMPEGIERDIRHCISDFIFQGSKQGENIMSVLSIKIDTEKLRNIVIRVMSSYDIINAHGRFARKIYRLYRDNARSRRSRTQYQEHNISYKFRESKSIEEHREFSMANAILEEIYSVFGVDVFFNEAYISCTTSYSRK